MAVDFKMEHKHTINYDYTQIKRKPFKIKSIGEVGNNYKTWDSMLKPEVRTCLSSDSGGKAYHNLAMILNHHKMGGLIKYIA